MMNELPYSPFQSFVIRTPMFEASPALEQFSKPVIGDEFLKEVFNREMVKEAIFLASPAFSRQMDKWLEGRITDAGDNYRIRNTLIRYFSRMSFRPTPFGLFAGISVGTLNGKNAIRLVPQKQYRLSTRLDSFCLESVIEGLCKEETVRQQLSYYPNSSIYTVGNNIRFAERVSNPTGLSYHLVSVGSSPALQDVLDASGSGVPYGQLLELLRKYDPDILSRTSFIDQLISCRLLVTEWETTVTGKNRIDHFIDTVPVEPGQCQAGDLLLRIKGSLGKMDQLGPGRPLE
jgi:hypothetical protein